MVITGQVCDWKDLEPCHFPGGLGAFVLLIASDCQYSDILDK